MTMSILALQMTSRLGNSSTRLATHLLGYQLSQSRNTCLSGPILPMARRTIPAAISSFVCFLSQSWQPSGTDRQRMDLSDMIGNGSRTLPCSARPGNWSRYARYGQKALNEAQTFHFPFPPQCHQWKERAAVLSAVQAPPSEFWIPPFPSRIHGSACQS